MDIREGYLEVADYIKLGDRHFITQSLQRIYINVNDFRILFTVFDFYSEL